MSQGKIGLGQAIILLLICRAFNILNYIPLFSQEIDIVSALIAIVICTILNFVLIIPAVILLKKYDGQNILDIAFHKNKFVGYLIAFIYGIYILISLIGTVYGFDFFMTTAVYPNASGFVIILSLCAICFMCARYGIEALARSSTIIFILFIAGVIFIGITSLKVINLFNLTPTLSNPTKEIISSMMTITSKNTEIYLVLLIAPKINGSITKCFIWYIIAAGVINFFINFLIIAVLGEYTYSQTIPYFTLASICETKVLQRLDSVHMVVWVFISFIKVTFYGILSAECFRKLLPKKAHKYVLISIFLITIITPIILTYIPEVIRRINTSTGLVTIALTLLIPLLLIPQRHKKGGSTHEKTIDSIANNPI